MTGFYIFKGLLKKKKKKQRTVCDRNTCGPQKLKYLLFGPLEVRFANPCCTPHLAQCLIYYSYSLAILPDHKYMLTFNNLVD